MVNNGQGDEIGQVRTWPQFAAYVARQALLGGIVIILLVGIDRHLFSQAEHTHEAILLLLKNCLPAAELGSTTTKEK